MKAFADDPQQGLGRGEHAFPEQLSNLWHPGAWHDMLAQGALCGLHRIERLLRQQGLKARQRRGRLCRPMWMSGQAPLDRAFEAPAPTAELRTSPVSGQRRAGFTLPP
jgi:transposase InsO family protein